MARNKEEQARMEGMAQALRIAKAKGIDGLEADLKMRNITGLPCAVSRAAMDECIMNIKYNVVDTFTILVAYTRMKSSDSERPDWTGLSVTLTSRRNAWTKITAPGRIRSRS